MRRYVLIGLAMVAMVSAVIAAGTPTTSAVAPTVVSPGNMNGWAIGPESGGALDGSGTFVAGPATPPAGTGSARLQLSTAAAGWAFGAAFPGTPLGNFTTLSYDTYRGSVDAGNNLAVALQFNVDYDLTDASLNYQSRIVFEPYQTFPGAVPQATWQSWNALTGNWWQASSATFPARVADVPVANVCPQATPCTLGALLAAYPNMGVHPTLGAVVLKAGSTWPGFDGNVDNLTIGVSGSDTTYDFEPDCSTVCYVRTDGSDANTGLADTPTDAKLTIQAAVAQVSAGGTVHVAPGTYVETGQIVINKNLTISGDTATKPVVKPAQNTGGSGDTRGWILINSGVTANLDHLVLDGTGFNVYQAIRSNGTGTIDRVDFQNMKYAQYVGFGVVLFGNMTVSNSTFSNIERVGVIAFGSGVTAAIIDGNTYTGKGAGDWLDYGVEVGGGATATITNNSISGNTGVASVDGSTSAGVIVTTYFGAGTAATLTGNTITGSTEAVAVGFDAVDTSTVVAHQNDFSGNGLGVNSTAPTVNATDNWWGSASGPQHASNTFNVPLQGVPVTNNVTFVPWLNAAPPAGVSFAPVTDTSPVGSFASIQAGVNASAPGGTVNAAAGTFTENVVIGNQVTIAGAGQASTFVIPAISNPNCNAGGGGSLCSGGGAASNIMLVQADNVTVHDIGLDGDNPALTSGIVQSGADLDARNGIITNHALAPFVYQNLVVHHTTVKNIYLRGIYASSGGSFNFHHDTVQNVKGEFASIGLFNFGGAGTFANNTVSDTNDAIASNWSTGSTYANNVVTDSGSGVHSDNNGGSGGVADSLQGNTVSNCKLNGFGVWVFAPFVPATVSQNTVTNCAVGLASAGQQVAVTIAFTDNEVDGQNLANSTGMYVTTSLFGFGDANSTVTMNGNVIKNNVDGFYIETTTALVTASLDAQRNSITGNTNSGVTTAGAGTLSVKMTPNWWGSDTGPAHALNPLGAGDSVPNGVIYSPWIGIGTDSSPSAGFQLTSPMTWIAGPAVCGATCIQAAIDDASNGDTVKAKTGVFNEHITINKDITVTEGSLPILDGGGFGDVVTITANGATLNGFEIRNGANGVVLTGVSGVTVSGNTIHDQRNVPGSAGVGIMAWGDNDSNTISGNTIHDNDRQGVFLGFSPAGPKSTGNTISGNTIYNNGQNTLPNGPDASQYGIQLWNADTNDIGTNTVYGHAGSGFGVGIYLCNSDSNNVHDNTVHDNQYNIAAYGCEEASTGNNIHLNTLSAPTDTNVRLFGGSPSSTVNANTMTDGKWGVKVSNGNTGASVTNNGITKFLQQGVGLYGVTGALVDGNTIDGQGSGTTADPGTTPDNDTRYYGIFAVDSTGTLSNNIIKGIKHGLLNGTQSGVGIRLSARAGAASSNMTISGNNISDVQKNAMVITNFYGGTSVNAIVTGNTVAGNGPIAYIAQNGIQVSGGATASVANNDASGYDYTPNTAAAIGILLIGAGTTSVTGNNVHDLMEGMYVQSSDGATVSGNSFTNFRDAAIFTYLSNNGIYTNNQILGGPGTYGLYIYDLSTNNSLTGNAFRDGDYGVIVDYSGPGAPTGNTFSSNCIAGNTLAGMATAGTQAGGPISAENNWWGKVDGPDPIGHGDLIDTPATIDAVPFLVATVAGCPVPLDGDGDGLNDPFDNCAAVYNPTQINSDSGPLPPLGFVGAVGGWSNGPSIPGDDVSVANGDGLGDACDPDNDNDSRPDAQELAGTGCPSASGDGATEVSAANGYGGIGPAIVGHPTWDTDGDTVPDGIECLAGTDPKVAGGVSGGADRAACNLFAGGMADTDGDGLANQWEVCKWGTNPVIGFGNTDGDTLGDCKEVMDVNGNGVVNASDATVVKQAVFAMIVGDLAAMDINANGTVNASDATLILQKVFAISPCL